MGILHARTDAVARDGPLPWGILRLVPLALLVHNLEEALTIGSALPLARELLPARLGLAPLLPSAERYQLALAAITLSAFALLAWARHARAAGYALVALQAAMVLNVAAHAAAATGAGRYVPGVVTAAALQLPLGFLVFRALGRARALSRREWAWLPAWAIVLHGPVLVGLLALVRLIPL